MSGLRFVVSMALAVACMNFHASPGRAQQASAPASAAAAAIPAENHFLFFAGTDLWRYGQFLYGGALWTPRSLDSDGFALKLLVNGGRYTFASGDLQRNVDGMMLSAAAMPGWRFSRNGFSVGLYAGPVVQDYRLDPYDPGSRLHRLYAGAEFFSDIWYQPRANVMAALNGSVASIGPTGMLRAQTGLRVFDALFVGPEAAALWCGDFQEMQFGVHLTGFRAGTFEWAGATGWSMDTDRRSGPYLRLGVTVRD